MKNLQSPNLVGIGLWGPEIWPHEYVIRPIEINVNWPGSYQLSGQFTLLSMGQIRYSCYHISGPHERIHVIWCVRDFHHVLLKYVHENAEMQKQTFQLSF